MSPLEPHVNGMLTSLHLAVSGIPRGYQFPREDGNWLTEAHRQTIRAVSPDIEIREIPAHTVNDAAVEGVNVLLAEGGNRTHYPGELDRTDYERLFTPSLRWVQICSTGFSDNITPQVLDGTVTLTNAPGLHTIPIAESALAAMLDHAKRLKQRRQDQRHRVWRQLPNDELFGRVVLIVGLGRIGQRVASLCTSLGMRVVGTKRSPGSVEHVDEVFPPSELLGRLPSADYIVLAVPHTPATTGMLGDREFQEMKPSAYFINGGRGAVVDEDAMVVALKEGRIGGAYLDAFTEEPLPDESPLWDLDNVLLVPHDSHSSPYIGDRMVELFCDNLRRYVAGQPLGHVCDPQRGY